jgi:hypothetical protein
MFVYLHLFSVRLLLLTQQQSRDERTLLLPDGLLSLGLHDIPHDQTCDQIA